MSARELRTDLAIIGAGPAGLFSAYYAGFRGLSTVVLDSLTEVGGQISAMYPEKLIHDVAGCPAIRGQDLVDNLVRQAAEYHPTYEMGVEVLDLVDEPDGVAVVTSGPTVHARAVLICAGAGRFRPRPLPAAAGFAGTGLSYFASQLEDYRDKRVVIVGGGDSAVDWALALEPIASAVTVVHRRDRFRAHAASVEKMKMGSATLMTPCNVVELHGTEKVEAVTVHDEAADTTVRLECDEVIAALGFVADISVMKSWGMNLLGHKIAVDERMRTGRERVYAAGDVTDGPGKVRLIAVGLGEAATAVNHIAHDLDPDSPLFPGHSTDAH
ncbi:NAD(P)/FAD-dependent oxidoreductase [Nocardioides marmotae]|uniref:Ferredoxin--NADP reductase n=1 Tax=Nocardioides marmotae TaxID=2663857 RepID=A0A6I3JAC0_9ACTN|nr:NAD(P)/FAD-dependent oxidoreductase [Nocardioides marmotae]MCR6030263.1 NAD(P)-binding protein [Gordonia jinghuaiqii]MBC9734446.1 NAD(P)/FAD-dependent oxidoreductase [Nocardioides marmotae]MTB85546.1 NAD(P)-binding protein [Nocardioides marmotae]MTB93895.1 NAD(P)-binding protein [Nocardioides marmotae]QKE00217.1 NAD(P)/FAD-dependent oxidoreductase [Nocardioides marmotae]